MTLCAPWSRRETGRGNTTAQLSAAGLRTRRAKPLSAAENTVLCAVGTETHRAKNLSCAVVLRPCQRPRGGAGRKPTLGRNRQGEGKNEARRQLRIANCGLRIGKRRTRNPKLGTRSAIRRCRFAACSAFCVPRSALFVFESAIRNPQSAIAQGLGQRVRQDHELRPARQVAPRGGRPGCQQERPAVADAGLGDGRGPVAEPQRRRACHGVAPWHGRRAVA